jgi:hypothetical protein
MTTGTGCNVGDAKSAHLARQAFDLRPLQGQQWIVVAGIDFRLPVVTLTSRENVPRNAKPKRVRLAERTWGTMAELLQT